MSNHLGNVLVTISDRKYGVDTSGDGQSDRFVADVLSAQDYYPFGMQMPERSFAAGNSYRYGFNGKENDSEVGIQDYGMRVYKPELGRFFSVDPVSKDFPWNSPYAFAENNVIQSIDLDGLEKYKIVGRSFAPKWSFTNSHFESIADNRTKFVLADYLAPNVSARIHMLVTVDFAMGAKKHFTPLISSQQTITKGGYKWDIDNQSIKIVNGIMNPVDKNAKVRGEYSAKNGMEFGPGIDIQFNIDMAFSKSKPGSYNDILTINTTITGNQFPAQETMIFDERGTGLFLGVSTAKGGPLTGVWGEQRDNVLSATKMNISVDQRGNFNGVMTQNAQGRDVIMSPEAWNKQFTDKPVWNLQGNYQANGQLIPPGNVPNWAKDKKSE